MSLPVEAIAHLATLAADLKQQMAELRELRREVRAQMMRARRPAKEGCAEVALMHSRALRHPDRPHPR